MCLLHEGFILMSQYSNISICVLLQDGFLKRKCYYSFYISLWRGRTIPTSQCLPDVGGDEREPLCEVRLVV